jgi:gamma-glutamyl:cysteine ligase YbdK (ATP-grasp superfamily)
MGYLCGEDSRLTTARSRQHQLVSVTPTDGFRLFVVEWKVFVEHFNPNPKSICLRILIWIKPQHYALNAT